MPSLQSYARLSGELEELVRAYKREYFHALEERCEGDRRAMAESAEISTAELEGVLGEIDYATWRWRRP